MSVQFGTMPQPTVIITPTVDPTSSLDPDNQHTHQVNDLSTQSPICMDHTDCPTTPPRPARQLRPRGSGRGSWTVPPYSPEDFRISQKSAWRVHPPSASLPTPEQPSQPAAPSAEVEPSSSDSFVSAQLTIGELLSAAQLPSDPTTFREAMTGPEREKWRIAAQEEFNSLIKNKTWSLQDLPLDRKAIEGKWLFKKKLQSDGTVDRYKARYVVRGFKQIPGVDYLENDLFSPVVRIPTLRYLFALAAELDLELQHLDICTAFLNGDLNEIIYIKQPEGFEEKLYPDKVCRLHKSLYGLKQAPGMWHQKIDDFLKSLGFKHSSNDPNLYVLYNTLTMVVIALYVDDLIMASNHPGRLQSIKTSLQGKFDMKDLGSLSYCLGVQIIRDRKA